MDKKKSPVWLYTAAAAAVIGLDQWLKAWVKVNIPLYPAAAQQIPLVPGILHLSHIHNSGVAFGLLQGGRWAFLALLAAFCVLVVWALATGKLTAPWEKWLAVLAMAGALSNGIDRALYGYVVDMLELEFIRFPVFNLADFVINVSCIAYVVLTLFRKEKTGEENGGQ